METNNIKEDLKLFRKLSIIELIYNEGKSCIKNKVLHKIIKQLNKDIIAVSIVLNNMHFNVYFLLFIIKLIRRKKISVSLTVNTSNINLKKLSRLKNDVSQIRLLINEKNNTSIVDNYFGKLKTNKNDIIFLFNINSNAENIRKYLKLLKQNNYIFNFSVDHLLPINEYWKLSKILSQAKKEFPLKIFQDLTCAGVIYDNLKGICPVLTSMICIGCNGEIKLCYKDKNRFNNSIFNKTLNESFNMIIHMISFCEYEKCKFDYNRCVCGCPLTFENNCNKYCFSNLKGGVKPNEKAYFKS
ncbi:MAG: hypothetical protein ACEPOV_09065 [Hyphomicrobiales bacterium]